MNNFRENAKEYRRRGQYDKALILYKNIIKDYEIKEIDNWLGWEYADTLKKCGELDSAIEMCKAIYKKDNNFKYGKDLLAWCLYEKFFRNEDIVNIIKLEDIAKFIINIVERDGDRTPYNKVVIRMINKFKKPFNSQKILKWLQKVDINYLSNEPIKYKVKDGKYLECASPFEEWYFLYCKALYNNNKYKECLEYIDKAFKKVNKFHNSYDVWLKRLEYLSLESMGNVKEAIEKVNILIKSNEVWIFYYDLAKMHMLLNENNKAIFYLSRALLFNGEDKAKINVYETMGQVLLEGNRYKEAKMHLLFGKQIRLKEGWKISDIIKTELEEVDKNYQYEIGISNLKSDLIKFWKNELLNYNVDRNIGEIITIGSNKKYGFIKGDNRNYYFKRSSVIDSKFIKIGMKVSYRVKKGFDIKKNEESFEAIEILIMEDI